MGSAIVISKGFTPTTKKKGESTSEAFARESREASSGGGGATVEVSSGLARKIKEAGIESEVTSRGAKIVVGGVGGGRRIQDIGISELPEYKRGISATVPAPLKVSTIPSFQAERPSWITPTQWASIQQQQQMKAGAVTPSVSYWDLAGGGIGVVSAAEYKPKYEGVAPIGVPFEEPKVSTWQKIKGGISGWFYPKREIYTEKILLTPEGEEKARIGVMRTEAIPLEERKGLFAKVKGLGSSFTAGGMETLSFGTTEFLLPVSVGTEATWSDAPEYAASKGYTGYIEDKKGGKWVQEGGKYRNIDTGQIKQFVIGRPVGEKVLRSQIVSEEFTKLPAAEKLAFFSGGLFYGAAAFGVTPKAPVKAKISESRFIEQPITKRQVIGKAVTKIEFETPRKSIFTKPKTEAVFAGTYEAEAAMKKPSIKIEGIKAISKQPVRTWTGQAKMFEVIVKEPKLTPKSKAADFLKPSTYKVSKFGQKLEFKVRTKPVSTQRVEGTFIKTPEGIYAQPARQITFSTYFAKSKPISWITQKGKSLFPIFEKGERAVGITRAERGAKGIFTAEKGWIFEKTPTFVKSRGVTASETPLKDIGIVLGKKKMLRIIKPKAKVGKALIEFDTSGKLKVTPKPKYIPKEKPLIRFATTEEGGMLIKKTTTKKSPFYWLAREKEIKLTPRQIKEGGYRPVEVKSIQQPLSQKVSGFFGKRYAELQLAYRYARRPELRAADQQSMLKLFKEPSITKIAKRVKQIRPKKAPSEYTVEDIGYEPSAPFEITHPEARATQIQLQPQEVALQKFGKLTIKPQESVGTGALKLFEKEAVRTGIGRIQTRIATEETALKSLTQLRQTQIARQRLREEYKLIQSQVQAQKQQQLFGLGQAVTQRQIVTQIPIVTTIPTTDTTTITETETIITTPEITRTRIPTRTGVPPPPVWIPPFPTMEFQDTWERKPRMKKQKKGYAPSLYAQVFGIKGRKPKVITGFEIRPMISSRL